MRSGSGQFRRTTMQDMGINNANTEGLVFICNVCEREFTPILLSGTCCGVDNKRPKEVVRSPEEQTILEDIQKIRTKEFICRKDLDAIAELQQQLYSLRKKQRNHEK